ncbi:alpha-(1,6)-fucosyltransferase-like isoform X2 [Ciona intestinalis]
MRFRTNYFLVLFGAIGCLLLSVVITREILPQLSTCNCTKYELNDGFLEKLEKMRTSTEVPAGVFERVILTRQIRKDIMEMWNALQYEFNNLKSIEDVHGALLRLNERHNALMIEIEDLLSFEEHWQKSLSNNLSDYVQSELWRLQNPLKCNQTAPQLFTKLSGCGLGCEVHNIFTKFLVALGQERTLFYDSKKISYTMNGFETGFLPPSENCQKRRLTEKWKQLIDDEISQNESCVYIKDSYDYKSIYKPQAVPSNLLPVIEKFHSHPFLWFAGQVVWYITRPNIMMKNRLTIMEEKVNFELPVVGIHVRRSDKLNSEGEGTLFFQPLSAYMKPAIDWYDRYEMRQIDVKVKKRIYLATDDQTVWEETKSFPEFEFFGNKSFAVRSNKIKHRRSTEGFFEVITDVNMLAKCNYIVGTLSSELSRLAYELMQTYHVDATDKFYSLDTEYGIDDQYSMEYMSQFNHIHSSFAEMELQVGDIVTVEEVMFGSQYVFGENQRTNATGLVPAFKLKWKIKQ